MNEREPEIKELEAQLKLFTKVAPLQAQLDAIESANQEMEDALENIDEDYQDLDAAAVKARIRELNAGMPAVAKKAAQAEEASEKVEALEEKLADSLEIEEAVKNLPKLKKEYDRAEAAFKKATDAVKEYRKKQNEGAVAEAAKLLKKGQPCPVCGSKEHPNAAKPGTFDIEHLEQLELDKENADFDRSTAKSEYDDAKKLAAKKFTPSADLKKEIATLSKLADNADEIMEVHEEAQAELEALNESQEFFIAYDAAEGRLAAAQKKIDTDLAKFKITEEELTEILDLDQEEISAEVSEFKERVNAIKALLAQDDFKKLPKANLLGEQIEKLQSSIAEIEDRLTDVNARIALQESTNERINLASDGVLDALKDEATLRTDSEATLKLKDWVAGKNTAGLSLTNFVLQERLEMILEYASRHLRRMSNGKYTFRLFEEKQGRTQKAGLGITILDSFAGKERPAETLSGGETFYASLALALGLVEVVKADNGGIELGTLFIDEGFGSLSDDTLEEVLDVLEDLRAERIIGIISHVEGMKTQIPIRLEVRPSDQGPSNVRVAVAGMK
jgi:exonuclease SbcC